MFRGSAVALVTPMTTTGEVDDAALEKLVEWHIANGTDALVAVGTTGESATLDMAEHQRVVAKIVALTRQRVPVIAGTGANATAEAVALTRHAEAAGADACLSVVPYYNKPTQEGLYRHFQAVATATTLPVILYNVPGRTACDLQPDTVVRLAAITNIGGIKEASTLERIDTLLTRLPGDFAVYSGEDALACEAMLRGAKGVISVTANAAPKAMAELCRLALAGRWEEALALDQGLQALHKALFIESNPIPVKWALARLGLMANGIRLPLTPLADAHHRAVETALAEAGLL
ncbi:MAG: 4-hydroxy-tetrahydrodipicolinate synthase [Candidatus Competibacterales bacterium]